MTRFLEDLREQPAALDGALASSLGPLAVIGSASAYDRVVLTGMGASLAAAHAPHLRLVDAGIAAWAIESGELLHYEQRLLTSETLLIVASQSGRSAEAQALLDAVDPGVRVVGVTNDPGSPLAQRADAALLLHAGSERTGVSTKTFTAMVALLLRVVDVLVGAPDPAPRLRTAVEPLARYLDASGDHIARWSRAMPSSSAPFVLGRGPSLGAAADGALTIKEAARVPAEAMGIAAFRHGPIELVDPRLTVIVLAGAPATGQLNRAFAEEVGRRGARVLWCGSPSAGLADVPVVAVDDELARTVVEHVPLQLLADHLAQATGTDPGMFRQATKVTALQ